MVEQRKPMANYYNSWKFTGKELDEETGLYYFGARYYQPSWSIWLSVDPLAEKFPSWSPYNFTMNNPLRYIDPDGRSPFDVIITGDKAKETFKQLNKSTSLRLKMDDNGNVTAKGKAKTDADKKLLAAINDKNITVEVDGTSSNYADSGKWFVGGAFWGSTVNEDGSVTANQTVNPEMAKTIDEFYGDGAGVTVMHEVLEAYIGAVDSPGTGVPTLDNTTPESKAFKSAHDKTQKVDPRHTEPTISQDQNTGYLYINKPHPVIPQFNVEKLINDLSKKKN